MSYTNRIIAVFGHRGSGKSTWLMRHIEEYKPYVLVDPLYDPKFTSLNLYSITSLEEGKKLFETGNPQRIYISPNLPTFDYFCGLILAKRNMTLVVDEVDNYASSYFISKYFKKAIKYGRHRGVNIIAACRRPKEMNPLLRSQANRFIIFPMGGEDAKELTSHIRDIVPVVIDLKTGEGYTEYIDYDFTSKKLSILKLELYKNTLDSTPVVV